MAVFLGVLTIRHRAQLTDLIEKRIHRALEEDYCPKGKKCTADSDDNWVRLGDRP